MITTRMKIEILASATLVRIWYFRTDQTFFFLSRLIPNHNISQHVQCRNKIKLYIYIYYREYKFSKYLQESFNKSPVKNKIYKKASKGFILKLFPCLVNRSNGFTDRNRTFIFTLPKDHFHPIDH